MNLGILGAQGQYKTTVSVGDVLRDVYHNKWYAKNECIGNVNIDLGHEYQYCDSERLRWEIRNIFKKNIRHKRIIIQEADGVWPARMFSNKEQTENLIGFWRDRHLFLKFSWDGHLDTGTDSIMRGCTHIFWIPKVDKLTDSVKIRVIDDRYKTRYRFTIHEIKLIQSMFDSWDDIRENEEYGELGNMELDIVNQALDEIEKVSIGRVNIDVRMRLRSALAKLRSASILKGSSGSSQVGGSQGKG